MKFRRFAWVAIWAVVLGCMSYAGWHADQWFMNFMEGGGASTINAASLVPADVTFFTYDPNFRKDWKKLPRRFSRPS